MNVQQIYNQLKKEYNKEIGLKLPNLKLNNKRVASGYTLVYLYANIGKWCSRADITSFLSKKGFVVTDLSEVRKLYNSNGWYIENKKGAGYKLVNVTETNPGFIPNKRVVTFINKEWVDLKNKYDNKCASCGAKDNQNHPQHPTRITKLERGHCVPGMDMSLGNIIPQCQFCNRAVIDKFIFSKSGSILTINKPELILKSPESVQKSVFELLKKKFEKDLILQQDSI